MKKLFLKFFLILIVLTISANAQKNKINCDLNYSIIELIANAERSVKREIGYPYLISFNEKINYGNYIHNKKYKRIDSRTLDCLELQNCVNILEQLVEQKITNIDLGAFQHNYIFHKYPLYDYFILENSYNRTCTILKNLIKRHGYSWQTIARYHSSTPKYNEKYKNILVRINNERENNEKNF